MSATKKASLKEVPQIIESPVDGATLIYGIGGFDEAPGHLNPEQLQKLSEQIAEALSETSDASGVHLEIDEQLQPALDFLLGSRALSLPQKLAEDLKLGPVNTELKAKVRGEGSLATGLRERLGLSQGTVGDAPELLVAEGQSLGKVLREALVVAKKGKQVLLIVHRGSGELIVGPLLSRGLERSLNLTVLRDLPAGALSVCDQLQLGVPWCGSDSLLDVSTKELAPILGDPIARTLWKRITIGPEASASSPIDNFDLANSSLPGKRFSLREWLTDSALEALESDSNRRALRDGELVSIENAFRHEYVEAVYASLNDHGTWQLHQGGSRDFHYSHHNIYDWSQSCDGLKTTQLIFGAQETLSWMREVSGMPQLEAATSSASWYMPGDYSLPHTDQVGERRIAFIWHLTRNWRPEWGGALYWCPTRSYSAASFNVLHLFKVTSESEHFVTPVAPWALGKRLTINGWWEGPESSED